MKYNFAPDWYVQVGAYRQNPSNLETGNGFKMSGSGTKGALLPVELIWQPKVGAEQLPGEYRLATITARRRPMTSTTTLTASRRG